MNLPDFARRPISQNLPCGVNPNALDDFSEIKRQVNKLNTVTSKISWKIVHSLSKNILLNESKDIRCACYYTVSATHVDGLKGFVGGLQALFDICLIYWYSAYPEESKSTARIGSIEWLTEHAVRKQKTLKISPSDLPLIEEGHKLTLKIEEELRSHYGTKSPSLGGIRRIFSQWIEEIQIQEEKEKKREESKDKKSKNTAEPKGINVNLSMPAMKAPVTKVETTNKPENNSKPLLIILIVLGFFLCMLFANFFYSDNQKRTLREQIETANIDDIVALLPELERKEDPIKQSIKSDIIKRTQWLVSGWELDPIRVNQLPTLTFAVDTLKTIYPDSAAAKSMQEKLTSQTIEFDNAYKRINRQFLKSRTVFANAKSQEKSIIKAYDYSNSLFPLLGRIEYAEKKMTSAEIDKTQRLLNIYQHKINTLKEEL
ncbi:type VI secretion system ImpA family N-terminal domain-containing protein [Aliivibrio logei]|uniref:type VI secretion system ImpA family N-terminal domain-containing protein n=1 Tax=Aliivibrio logei TaxID=688 RepID=UPI0035C8D55B